MKTRIITGIFLIIAVFLWLFWPATICVYITKYLHFGSNFFLNPSQIFFIGLDIIVIIAGYEWSKFFVNEKSKNKYLQRINGDKRLKFLFGIIFSIFILSLQPNIYEYFYSIGYPLFRKSYAIFVNLAPVFNIFLCMAAVWWIISIPMVLFYPTSAKFIDNAFVKVVIGVIVLTAFLYSCAYVKILESDSYNFMYQGSKILLSIMVLVWCADSGAYFVGRFFGKHHMSPHVSPKKTYEGLFGGIVLAMIAYAILAYNGCYGIGYTSHPVILSITAVITIIFSVFGDLTESLFKRESGMKDSGIIFPGHGGMLDRIDSLLAAIPMFVVTYATIAYFTVD